MTHLPDFDELVGTDVAGAERDRLQRVHELLVQAGPPPELSPELAAGPNLMLTRRRSERVRRGPRVLTYVAAAAAVAAVAFAAGRATRSSDTFSAARTVPLTATAAAPNAHARIEIANRTAGNWAMRLVGSSLPTLHGRDYYEVFLVRNGKVVGPCGSFVAHGGSAEAYLNAPYALTKARWIVTVQSPTSRKLGRVVLTSGVI